jgi:hypothetical protein
MELCDLEDCSLEWILARCKRTLEAEGTKAQLQQAFFYSPYPVCCGNGY